MDLQEAKRQRRLRRLYNRIRHEQRLRIPKFRPLPQRLGFWRRILNYLQSFFHGQRQTKIHPR